MPWICHQPWVTWWHPGPHAGWGCWGQWHHGGLRCGRTAALLRGPVVWVSDALLHLSLGKVLYVGLLPRKKMQVFLEMGKQACAPSSPLSVCILITSSCALTELEKPLLRARHSPGSMSLPLWRKEQLSSALQVLKQIGPGLRAVLALERGRDRRGTSRLGVTQRCPKPRLLCVLSNCCVHGTFSFWLFGFLMY